MDTGNYLVNCLLAPRYILDLEIETAFSVSVVHGRPDASLRELDSSPQKVDNTDDLVQERLNHVVPMALSVSLMQSSWR